MSGLRLSDLHNMGRSVRAMDNNREARGEPRIDGPAPRLSACEAPYVPAADMPMGQKIALLTLRSRATLAGKALERLRAQGIPNARYEDYRALTVTNYVIERSRMNHALTPMGQSRADELARLFARSLGIHQPVYNSDRFHNSLWCTCGATLGGRTKNQGHWSAVAGRLWGDHMADVNSHPAPVSPPGYGVEARPVPPVKPPRVSTTGGAGPGAGVGDA